MALPNSSALGQKSGSPVATLKVNNLDADLDRYSSIVVFDTDLMQNSINTTYNNSFSKPLPLTRVAIEARNQFLDQRIKQLKRGVNNTELGKPPKARVPQRRSNQTKPATVLPPEPIPGKSRYESLPE